MRISDNGRRMWKDELGGGGGGKRGGAGVDLMIWQFSV